MLVFEKQTIGSHILLPSGQLDRSSANGGGPGSKTVPGSRSSALLNVIRQVRRVIGLVRISIGLSTT